MGAFADSMFDVAIIGGGAAGSAAALTLLQAEGCSVCIVENSDFAEPRVGETIPPDTNHLLLQLGVKRAFETQGHLPCYGSHSLWGSNQLGHNDFLTSPHGNGWHLDRNRFDRMLLDQVAASGARLFAEECTGVQCSGDLVDHIETSSRKIRARHYIDATGRSAKVMRAFGVSHRFDDRQAVIWAKFKVADKSLGNSTWLEATRDGWWYAAEVPGGNAVVALGTDPRVAKSGGLYHLPNWAAALSGTYLIAPKLARAKLQLDSFRVTSSHSYIAERVVGGNWITVGDAASAFDPLSSAGIYKALLTGQMAARSIRTGDYKSYARRVLEDYQAYLLKRQELYAVETRWRDNIFWAARHKLAGEIPQDRNQPVHSLDSTAADPEIVHM